MIEQISQLGDLTSNQHGDKSEKITSDELKYLLKSKNALNIIFNGLSNIDSVENKTLKNALLTAFKEFFDNNILHFDNGSSTEFILVVQLLGLLNNTLVDGNKIEVNGIYSNQTQKLFEILSGVSSENNSTIDFKQDYEEITENSPNIMSFVNNIIEKTVKKMIQELSNNGKIDLKTDALLNNVIQTIKSIDDSLDNDHPFKGDLLSVGQNFLGNEADNYKKGKDRIDYLKNKLFKENKNDNSKLNIQDWEFMFKSVRDFIGTAIDIAQTKDSNHIQKIFNESANLPGIKDFLDQLGNKRNDFEKFIVNILPQVLNKLGQNKSDLLGRFDVFFDNTKDIILKYANGDNNEENLTTSQLEEKRQQEGYILINNFWQIIDGIIATPGTVDVVIEGIQNMDFVNNNPTLKKIIGLLNDDSFSGELKQDLLQDVSRFIDNITKTGIDNNITITGLLDGILIKLNEIFQKLGDPRKIDVLVEIAQDILNLALSSNMDQESKQQILNNIVDEKSLLSVRTVTDGVIGINSGVNKTKGLFNSLKSFCNNALTKIGLGNSESNDLNENIDQNDFTRKSKVITIVDYYFKASLISKKQTSNGLLSTEGFKLSEFQENFDTILSSLINLIKSSNNGLTNAINKMNESNINVDEIYSHIEKGNPSFNDFSLVTSYVIEGIIRDMVENNRFDILQNTAEGQFLTKLSKTLGINVSQSFQNFINQKEQFEVPGVNEKGINFTSSKLSELLGFINNDVSNVLIKELLLNLVNLLKTNIDSEISKADLINILKKTLIGFLQNKSKMNLIFNNFNKLGFKVNDEYKNSFSNKVINFLEDEKFDIIFGKMIDYILNKLSGNNGLSSFDINDLGNELESLLVELNTEKVNVIELFYDKIFDADLFKIIISSNPKLSDFNFLGLSVEEISVLSNIIKKYIPPELVASHIEFDNLYNLLKTNNVNELKNILINVVNNPKFDINGLVGELCESGIIQSINNKGSDEIINYNLNSKDIQLFTDGLYSIDDNSLNSLANSLGIDKGFINFFLSIKPLISKEKMTNLLVNNIDLLNDYLKNNKIDLSKGLSFTNELSVISKEGFGGGNLLLLKALVDSGIIGDIAKEQSVSIGNKVQIKESDVDNITSIFYNTIKNDIEKVPQNRTKRLQEKEQIVNHIEQILLQAGFGNIIDKHKFGLSVGESFYSLIQVLPKEDFAELLKSNLDSINYLLDEKNFSSQEYYSKFANLSKELFGIVNMTELRNELMYKKNPLSKNSSFFVDMLPHIQKAINNISQDNYNRIVQAGGKLSNYIDGRTSNFTQSEINEFYDVFGLIFEILNTTINSKLNEYGSDNSLNRQYLSKNFELNLNDSNNLDGNSQELLNNGLFDIIKNNFGFVFYWFISSIFNGKEYAVKNGVLDYFSNNANKTKFQNTFRDILNKK